MELIQILFQNWKIKIKKNFLIHLLRTVLVTDFRVFLELNLKVLKLFVFDNNGRGISC